MKNNESNKHLSHIMRLQTKIEEVKRMENEEFVKIRRDEFKFKKELDEIKLKLKRTQDELTKLKLKEEEINSLRDYFAEKKQLEENEVVKKQLQYEKEKLSLLGLIRSKDKNPILKLVEYLEMHEINKIASLNKTYRSTLWNDWLFIWKSAYRSINIAHREKELELEKEIQIKSLEIKSIIPYKQFDLLNLGEDQEEEIDLKMLIQMYVWDNNRVGDWIKNTMYSTKIFLNDQYKYMQKLYMEEQERIRKEKERAIKEKQMQNINQSQKSTGFASRFLSAFKLGGSNQQPEQMSIPQKNVITEAENDNNHNYLISTNAQVEDANLINFDDDKKLESSQINEKEVRVWLDEKEVPDDEETKKSETDTVVDDKFEDHNNSSSKFEQQRRPRSDSISSTSTSRMYSYSDFNDFMNVDELNKFLYKWGAMLVSKKGMMDQWIEWMQRTLSEYYVYCQVLYKQAKDVEILKDFFSQNLQKTKYKLEMVTNEKEDLIAKQEAEFGIKEYLAKKMQELNMKLIEKHHELVIVKQTLNESKAEIKEIQDMYDQKQAEYEKVYSKYKKEIKSLTKKLKIYELENNEFKDIYEEIKGFVEMRKRNKGIK